MALRLESLTLLAVVTLMACASPLHAQATPQPERDQAIRLLRGNLYHVRDGQEHTVLLVTRDGILLVDPLSRAAATALKQQLETRFPGVPVRYVVLTHHHADRAAGAGIFEKAQLVAERSYSEALSRSRRENNDEYRFVRDVRDTFATARTITLGGTSVRLAHVRSRHAAEMAVVHFPDEKLLFAVAPPPVTSVPFSFGFTRPRDTLGWIDVVADLQPDTLLFDDGETMEGAAFQQLAEYLSALRTDVAEQYERGRSITEIQATPLPASQRSVPHYAARNAQISAVYRSTRLVRWELSGRAIASYTSRNDPMFCESSFSVCSAGGAVPGGSVGAAITLGHRFGITAEGTLNQQMWSSRARPAFQEETVQRFSRMALLFRYGAPRPGQFSFLPVAGMSRTTGDVRGLSHITGVLTPVGGYHPIEERTTRTGLTFGVDLVRTTGGGFSIGLPIRLTRMNGERPQHWPSMFDVQAGVGISVQLMRRVSVR